MRQNQRSFAFLKAYRNLNEVLTDHELASLGDSYVNFVYSIALSNRRKKPLGTKVKGSILAEAVRKAGLREILPSRMTKHTLADAAEALLVYGWLNNCTSITESVEMLQKTDDSIAGFGLLLATIKDRATFP